MGRDWNEQASFPDRISNLFYFDNLLFAIGVDAKRRKSQVFISNNKGRNWIDSFTLKNSIFHDPIVYKKGILFLSNNKAGTYFPNLLIKYNVDDHSNMILKLPQGFKCYLLTNYANEIKLCGKQNNHIVTYIFKNDSLKFEYSIPKTDSIDFPETFYNTANEDMIVIGHRRGFDVGYKILKTSDNGKSWETINFIRDNYIKPYYFFNDKNKIRAYFFSGSGTFQVLK